MKKSALFFTMLACALVLVIGCKRETPEQAQPVQEEQKTAPVAPITQKENVVVEKKEPPKEAVAVISVIPTMFTSKPELGAKAKCPISGEEVQITDQTPMAEHQGKHVAFCSAACKAKFKAEPDKYLATKSPDEGVATEDAPAKSPLAEPKDAPVDKEPVEKPEK